MEEHSEPDLPSAGNSNAHHLPQISPRTVVAKARSLKKNKSTSQMGYNSLGSNQGTSGQNPDKNGGSGMSKQLYEVDTEKLLLSNDKVTITDLWKSSPQPSFPYFFLKVLDLDHALAEAQKKAENLRSKIDKRKLDERRKEEAKVEKANRMREEQMEQRR